MLLVTLKGLNIWNNYTAHSVFTSKRSILEVFCSWMNKWMSRILSVCSSRTEKLCRKCLNKTKAAAAGAPSADPVMIWGGSRRRRRRHRTETKPCSGSAYRSHPMWRKGQPNHRPVPPPPLPSSLPPPLLILRISICPSETAALISHTFSPKAEMKWHLAAAILEKIGK